MRIGIDARVIKKYPGVGRYALSLIRTLARIDLENEYVIFKNRLCPEKLTDNPNFKEIVVDVPLFSLRSLFTFHKIVLRENVDFLHCAYHLSPLSKSVDKVVMVHDLMDISFPGHFSHQPFLIDKGLTYYFKFATPRTIKGARLMITNSERTKLDILNLFPSIPEERIEVAHLAVEDYFRPALPGMIEEAREKYDLPDRFLLYVGNTKIYKNLDCMIKGYHLYRKERKLRALPLIIAGMKNVAGDRLTDIIKGLGLAESVRIIGAVDEKDLAAVYSAAQWFVFPSLHEGFGFPTLEAMSCGTPVIVSNAGAIPEVVGDAGLYFDPRHPEELGKILLEVVDNVEVASKYEIAGLERAKKFSWEKTARQTLDVYKRMRQ